MELIKRRRKEKKGGKEGKEKKRSFHYIELCENKLAIFIYVFKCVCWWILKCTAAKRVENERKAINIKEKKRERKKKRAPISQINKYIYICLPKYAREKRHL